MPVVEQVRGPCVEARHPFSAVRVQAGRVDTWLGAPVSSTWRSAAKPFQLACALELLGDPDLDETELAVGAASHSGEPVHVDLVRSLLQRFGVQESDLRCAAHPPAHEPSAWAILRAGGTFTDIHNNCSGKHTFMLAACRKQGWSLDYLRPDHPLQQHIRHRIAVWCGRIPDAATDGCGAPTFGLPIDAFAEAWCRLAEAMAAVKDGTAQRDQPRLGQIGRAMMHRPDLTSGTGRLDLHILQGAREPMAVKVGAMGLFCMAFPERGCGVTVKVHSGASEALGPAVAEALEQLVPDAWQQPEDWPWHTLRNVAGREVGELRVTDL